MQDAVDLYIEVRSWSSPVIRAEGAIGSSIVDVSIPGSIQFSSNQMALKLEGSVRQVSKDFGDGLVAVILLPE